MYRVGQSISRQLSLPCNQHGTSGRKGYSDTLYESTDSNVEILGDWEHKPHIQGQVYLTWLWKLQGDIEEVFSKILQTMTDQQQAAPPPPPPPTTLLCLCKRWHTQKEVSHLQRRSLIAMCQSKQRLKVLECGPASYWKRENLFIRQWAFQGSQSDGSGYWEQEQSLRGERVDTNNRGRWRLRRLIGSIRSFVSTCRCKRGRSRCLERRRLNIITIWCRVRNKSLMVRMSGSSWNRQLCHEDDHWDRDVSYWF